MALTIPVNYGIAALVTNLDGHATPYINTFGFRDTIGTRTADTLANVFDTFVNSGTTNLISPGKMSSNYSYRGVKIQVMKEGGMELGEKSVNVAGTKTSSSLPPNVSFLMKKRTASAGRENRGRAFFPPYHASDGEVDQQGVILGTVVTAINTLLASFLASATANDVPLYLLHSTGSLPTLITSLAIDPLVATQRRRLR